MQHMAERAAGGSRQLWAVALGVLPPAVVAAMAFLPWHGGRHLPDSIVFTNRAVLFTGLLMALVSLYLSAQHFRSAGFSIAAAVAVVFAAGFVIWAAPFAYGVIAAIVCGACSAA